MTQKHEGSLCLQGYVQVGRKKEGSPNVLGNFNFKKILSTFTLKITCNIYFMTTHLQVFIGQRVNFEPDTPQLPVMGTGVAHGILCVQGVALGQQTDKSTTKSVTAFLLFIAK